jgi:hypothetical protein
LKRFGDHALSFTLLRMTRAIAEQTNRLSWRWHHDNPFDFDWIHRPLIVAHPRSRYAFGDIRGQRVSSLIMLFLSGGVKRQAG